MRSTHWAINSRRSDRWKFSVQQQFVFSAINNEVLGKWNLFDWSNQLLTDSLQVVLSVVAAVAWAAPANVYSPYLLQDLAYQSVDANQDGQPDQAIAIHHPVAPLVHAVAPVAHAVAAPVAYHAPAVHAFAPVQTRIHYASTPVVVGHTAQILKPALAAPVAAPVVAVKAEEKAAVAVAAPVAYAHAPVAYAAAPAVHTVQVAAPAPVAYAAAPVAVAAPAPVALNLAAPVPAGDAPPFEELYTQEKVLAPVRANTKVTPQVTVQLPTKVNVEKVAVDVPVAAPYAHPVPVPVAAPVAHHVAYAAPYPFLKA